MLCTLWNKAGKRLLAAGFALMLITSAALTFAVPLSAQGRTVRVGVFDFKGFYETSEAGINFGYGYDYLNEIAKYTGYKYEFVKGTWSELLEKLKTGEIDMLDSVARTNDEFEELYNFCEYPTGTSFGALFVRSDNEKIAYNDYENIDGCKVGMLKGDQRSKDYIDFSIENNFTTTNVEYSSASAVTNALKNGEVDAIVTSNLRKEPNETIVARFAASPFYIMTSKDESELASQIDKTLKNIQTNELYFNTNLHKKYYDADKAKISFTRVEQDFIAKAEPFTMVYDPDWAPFEYHDDKNNSVAGINFEIVSKIFEECGLKFELIHVDSYEKCIEMVGNGEVDILMSFDSDISGARNLGMVLSDTFISSPFVLMGKELNITDDKIIALPNAYIVAKEYAASMFPKNKVIFFENIDDCYDAIMSGKADYTFESLHVAGQIIKAGKYNGLSIVHTTSLLDSFSIAARGSINPIVLDILNKGIAALPSEAIEGVVYNSSLNATKQMSFANFFGLYRVEIITAALVAILLLACVLAYIIIIQVKNRKALSKIAYYDELTGLINLSKFKLDAVSLLEKTKKEDYHIVRFDVREFKLINDMFGYSSGDKVLMNIVKAVTQTVQKGELFARAGSDNFVMLVREQIGRSVKPEKEKIIKAFEQMNSFDDTVYDVSFSAGVYRIRKDDDITDFSALLDKAIMAHKVAKRMESNSVAFYDDKIRDEALHTKEIENTMQGALETGEFKLFLQPKYRLSDESIVGAEALVRWVTKSGKMIFPDSFIPIFERNGFVLKLDMYMLRNTCIKLREWIDEGLDPVPVSVNFSRNHFKDELFVQNILRIVREYEIPEKLIEIELTESTMIANEKNLLSIVKALHQEGISLSMDDFGIGYSSLGLLKSLPVDVIKIDKSFFDKSSDNVRAKAVVASVIAMARRLEIHTVAEGIETKENVDLLKSLSCDMVQGYYYAKPMSTEDFDLLFKKSLEKLF